MIGLPGETYFILGVSSRLIKIGATWTPGSRLAALAPHYREELQLLHSIWSNDPFGLEGLLKGRYKRLGRGARVNDYANPNANGRSEWYPLTDQDLQELMNLVEWNVSADGQILAKVRELDISVPLIKRLDGIRNGSL